MAKGENANKRCGREYWSPRHPGAPSWGAIGKQLTHEKDRMKNKKIVQNEMKNLDDKTDEK